MIVAYTRRHSASVARLLLVLLAVTQLSCAAANKLNSSLPPDDRQTLINPKGEHKLQSMPPCRRIFDHGILIEAGALILEDGVYTVDETLEWKCMSLLINSKGNTTIRASSCSVEYFFKVYFNATLQVRNVAFQASTECPKTPVAFKHMHYGISKCADPCNSQESCEESLINLNGRPQWIPHVYIQNTNFTAVAAYGDASSLDASCSYDSADGSVSSECIIANITVHDDCHFSDIQTAFDVRRICQTGSSSGLGDLFQVSPVTIRGSYTNVSSVVLGGNVLFQGTVQHSHMHRSPLIEAHTLYITDASFTDIQQSVALDGTQAMVTVAPPDNPLQTDSAQTEQRGYGSHDCYVSGSQFSNISANTILQVPNYCTITGSNFSNTSCNLTIDSGGKSVGSVAMRPGDTAVERCHFHQTGGVKVDAVNVNISLCDFLTLKGSLHINAVQQVFIKYSAFTCIGSPQPEMGGCVVAMAKSVSLEAVLVQSAMPDLRTLLSVVSFRSYSIVDVRTWAPPGSVVSTKHVTMPLNQECRCIYQGKFVDDGIPCGYHNSHSNDGSFMCGDQLLTDCEDCGLGTGCKCLAMSSGFCETCVYAGFSVHTTSYEQQPCPVDFFSLQGSSIATAKATLDQTVYDDHPRPFSGHLTDNKCASCTEMGAQGCSLNQIKANPGTMLMLLTPSTLVTELKHCPRKGSCPGGSIEATGKLTTVATPREYIVFPGDNSYVDHGGTDMDNGNPFRGLTLSQCTAKCDENALCGCVVFEDGTKDSTHNCWRRSNCHYESFSKNDGYSTYMKPSGYSKYTGWTAQGNGDQDIDHQGVLVDDEAACEERCTSDLKCSCVTYHNSSKMCWKQANCKPTHFVKSTSYDVLLNQARIGNASAYAQLPDITTSHKEMCADGYMGPGCALCAAGFGRSPTDPLECKRCGKENTEWVILVALQTFGAALALWGAWGERKPTKQKVVAVYIKQLMFFCTVNLVALGAVRNALASEGGLLRLVNGLHSASSSANLYTGSFDCLGVHNSLGFRILFTLFVPLSIYMLAILCSICLPANRLWLLMSVPLAMSNTVLPSLQQQMSTIVSCIQLTKDSSGLQAWAQDHACSIGLDIVFVFWSIAALVFGPVLWVYLTLKVTKPWADEQRQELIGFLTAGYKKQYSWWEAVKLTQKLTLVTIGGALPLSYSSVSVCFTTLLVLFLSLVLQLWFMPYDSDYSNHAESATLAVCVGVMLGSQFTLGYTDSWKENHGVTLFVVIIMALAVLLALLCYAYLIIRQLAQDMMEFVSSKNVADGSSTNDYKIQSEQRHEALYDASPPRTGDQNHSPDELDTTLLGTQQT